MSIIPRKRDFRPEKPYTRPRTIKSYPDSHGDKHGYTVLEYNSNGGGFQSDILPTYDAAFRTFARLLAQYLGDGARLVVLIEGGGDVDQRRSA